jgi:hypothetical protein
MSTVIFKWNPAFSSSPMIGYLENLYNICHDQPVDFNWSVWDHDKIHAGDRYYWVKLGYGQVGIVSAGTITSDPYQGEDWSGKGRETYYVDYEPDVMINPDTLPILTSQELTREIPDFDWYKGHSGIVLNEQQAANLEILWHNFIKRNEGFWQKAIDSRYKDQLWMVK